MRTSRLRRMLICSALRAARSNAVLREVSGSPLPETRLFWRLLDCQLPDLVELPLKHVVAMRRNGDFELWRRAVTDGLLRVEALTGHDNDWPGIPAAAKHEIAVSVQEAAKAARRSLDRSQGKKVTAGIDMAVVGGAMAATFVAPPISTALVGLAALRMLCHAVLR